MLGKANSLKKCSQVTPGGISGQPYLVISLNFWNTASDEIHGRPSPRTMWGKDLMDGPAMMASSCFTLVYGFWFGGFLQLELSYPMGK